MKLRDRKKRAFSVQKQEPKAAEKLGKRGKTQNKKAPSTQLPLLDVPHVEEEPEVVQIKKVKKPRKVVHSYEQASRIARGKTQRMFLLNVSRQLSTWDASIVIWRSQVLGHSGNIYSVTISNTLSCSCPDYYRQRKPCKHIYFMISQVAQFDEFFDKMNNTLSLTKPKLQELDEALSKRLAPRIKAKQDKKQQNKEQLPDIDLGDEVDCAICFQEFDKTQKLFECQQCKKHFHQPCMDAWKSKNTTCPLCRHDLTFVFERKRDAEVAGLVGIDELDPDHPLKRLQAVSLT